MFDHRTHFNWLRLRFSSDADIVRLTNARIIIIYYLLLLLLLFIQPFLSTQLCSAAFSKG